VVDDAAGMVYVADETVGIWRIGAEPESDLAGRELVDLVAPRGALGEEVKGLAIHAAEGAKYLLAADEEAPGVHVYALPEGRHIGLVTPAAVEGAKIEAIAAAGFGPGALQSGFVLVADEEGSGGPAYRVLKWDAIAAALQLPAAMPVDPRVVPAATARTVEPTVETQPVDEFGDAADDPAIWVHPTDPGKSLVIASQKQRGIEVYDLAGKRLQVLPVGRVNNVDLRQDVLLGGRKRDVVLGSNREQKSLALYEVDAAARKLVDAVAAPIPAGMHDPYGVCLYHSAKSGKLYAFMNNSDAGEFRQWEIEAAEGGKLTAKVVREFTVGTQAEGCVADDETGALYVAEEDIGLWRYGAEPDAGTSRKQLDATGEAGHLKADVEGVAIYHGKNGTGYLIVSNQGADDYAVYRRENDNAFIGHFSIVANDKLGIDGASETDGLDVTSSALGKAFPQGLLVVQDGRNITPAERQNFKLVPWERVAAALGL
jgi:3-phytase